MEEEKIRAQLEATRAINEIETAAKEAQKNAGRHFTLMYISEYCRHVSEILAALILAKFLFG